ncbi:hydroxyisourate hydrolase [Halocatena halophila]|uniref:hydroxyisourate hydrolase n=1 Tax=Halocatena halophila TaxID=2814576 RepID=UPI002ED27401
MSGDLTTHVLDTGREGPAAGVTITLQRLEEDGQPETITTAVTNDDGRVDSPLLEGDAMVAGQYQLLFEVGPYYREQQNESSFLETVPVRFVIDAPDESYHVPLLLSPGGYTTYRGS